VITDGGTHEFDHGVRKLQGAMLEHANLAIERMPGLAHALNRFIAETPHRLTPLIARISGGSIEQVRSTTLLQAIGDCSGLTAAVYASVEPEARLMIALDERIDDLIIASIFGEAIAAGGAADPRRDPDKPRTAIEAALLEAFARALGTALQAGFAPFAPIVLNFERFATLTDSFVLEKRDNEAAAARFSLQMNGGACECLVLLPETFLLPFRKELEHDPEAETPAADRRWSRLMEAGVRQTRLPVTAILEEVHESRRDRQS
jgi:flagellar motor switch protein FliM